SKDRSLPGDLAGLLGLLVVDKEKSPVSPIEQFRDQDRAAETAAVLIEQYSGSWSFASLRVIVRGSTVLRRLYVVVRHVAVSEQVVGIEPRVAKVLVKAAVKFVGPLTGDEPDLGPTVSCALSLRCGRGNTDFLHRVEAGGDAGEETIG